MKLIQANSNQFQPIETISSQLKIIQPNSTQTKLIQANSSKFEAIETISSQFKSIQANSIQMKLIIF
jgi:hypothetical protein